MSQPKAFWADEQLNWITCVLSPFVEVTAKPSPSSHLKIKVRRFENGICRAIISAKNVSILNSGALNSEFFIGKIVRGHLDVTHGPYRFRHRKGDLFYLPKHGEWKMNFDNGVIVGLLLPCDGNVRSDKQEPTDGWDCLGRQFKYSDIERISKVNGGMEFLAKCVLGVENIRFVRRYTVMTMIFRNIQRGDLRSKQLAIDLGVSDAAICAYRLNKKLSVPDYLRLLRSFK